jgi:alkanesulfonate monooxygenase SsuD/methylene tetrahydromethanopterin reductase-like flavin-dependent oxidoreductase (luciferase family)
LIYEEGGVQFGYYVLNTYVPELDGPAAAVYGRYLEQIDAVEAVGFDTVWVTEHHFAYFGGMTPNPQLLLAAVSQRTRRLRLGTSVSILPLHHPLRIAEDFAVLDVLSGGRVEFGAGRGMVHSGYAGYGLDWPSAQERLKEALELIRRAWTEPAVTFTGRFYQCREVTLMPRPLQQPHPPIWVTATLDPASFRWIGEQGYDLMLVPWLFPVAETLVPLYREARAAAGHPGPGRVLAMYPAHVAETAAEARAVAEPAWLRWLALALPELRAGRPDAPWERLLSYDRLVTERHVLFGGIEECIANARWIAATFGVTHLGLTFYFGGIAHTAALRAIELWGRAVAPALRAALGTGVAS